MEFYECSFSVIFQPECGQTRRPRQWVVVNTVYSWLAVCSIHHPQFSRSRHPPPTAFENCLNGQQKNEKTNWDTGASGNEPRCAFGTVNSSQEDEQCSKAGQREARTDDTRHSSLRLFMAPYRHLGRASSAFVRPRSRQLVLYWVYLQINKKYISWKWLKIFHRVSFY